MDLVHLLGAKARRRRKLNEVIWTALSLRWI
jgi:hypothetical protein